MKPPAAVALIITTYNWPQALDLCLRSVARQTQPPQQVIIADDGSSASTREVMERWRHKAKMPLLHCWQEDLGFRLNRSRNNGILAAATPYVVLIDGDMVLDRHFIADHLRAARPGQFVQGTRVRTDAKLAARLLQHQQLDVPIWQPGIKGRQHQLRIPWLADQLTRAKASLKRIKGCNQGYWRSDLETINGFNEAFSAWGPDDQELAVRLFNAGIKRRYLRFAARALHLYHRENPSDLANPGFKLLAKAQNEHLIRCDLGLAQRRAALTLEP